MTTDSQYLKKKKEEVSCHAHREILNGSFS